MSGQLDHANVNVLNIDRAVEFLSTALPGFRVRGGGTTDREDRTERWLHFGSDDVYVCLNESSLGRPTERNGREETGINHVGFTVDDVDALLAAYESGGFRCARMDESPSRLRLYVTDADGITWEFIQYLSDDPAVRNDYSV